MSPLDLSVIFFFVLITGKALSDSFKFWKEQDEAATIEYELAARKARPAVNTATKNTVRVTRTQYRVYHRIDNRKPALSPAPLRKDLHLRRGADKQMKTAA